MEGFALPSTSVPRLSKVEFSVSRAQSNEAYTICAWGEEPLYPHSQIAEMHDFIQQPHLAALLGWFGVTSSRTGSQHTVEIPTAKCLRKKIEAINQHLYYPVPQLALCNDIMGDSDHLSLHSQNILPVFEQTLHGTNWKAWHHTIHDLFTHAASWILAPQEAHALSQTAAFCSQDAAPEVKSEISEMIDEFYSIDCMGNCLQTKNFRHLINDPSSGSTLRTIADLSALSMADFDLFSYWSFWQAGQNRIKELSMAVRTIQSVQS